VRRRMLSHQPAVQSARPEKAAAIPRLQHQPQGVHSMPTRCRLFIALCLLAVAPCSFAQDDHAYTEGQVTAISYVKVKPGMFDEYLRYLQTTYKKVMEGQKKAGLVVAYNVYSASPRSPHDPDLYLTITYKNWAAFDGLTEKTDAITKEVWGSLDKSNQASIDREKMREILGGEIIQELVLK
jgi:hypothetical protein